MKRTQLPFFPALMVSAFLVAVFALLLALAAPGARASGTFRDGTPHPEGTGTHQVEGTETAHPEGTETEHPEATETEHPHATETEHPHATETAHPEATHTPGPQASRTPEASHTPGASDSRVFAPTGQRVSGQFLHYWDTRGGLTQQGYPISAPLQEKSDLNGQTYTVQYFERAVFEQHPENAAPFNVLLAQLGTFRYRQRYPQGAPSQVANTSAGSVLFRETNHRLGGAFLTYWQGHGGLAQQGFPISEEFTEVSPLDGKAYRVQYFERAVFEAHPENAGTPFTVLLSQLGTFQYQAKHGR